MIYIVSEFVNIEIFWLFFDKFDKLVVGFIIYVNLVVNLIIVFGLFLEVIFGIFI